MQIGEIKREGEAAGCDASPLYRRLKITKLGVRETAFLLECNCGHRRGPPGGCCGGCGKAIPAEKGE
jgi:hypothetical protein